MSRLSRLATRLAAILTKHRQTFVLPCKTASQTCAKSSVTSFARRDLVTSKCRVLYSSAVAMTAPTSSAIEPQTLLNEEDSSTVVEDIKPAAHLGDSVSNLDSVDGASECVLKKQINKGKEPRKRKNKGPALHATFKRPRLTSDDAMAQTTHYIEDGLRKVVPYDFQYNTFCKGRWVGKTLGELYTKEFRLFPIGYYEKAVRENRVLVNLKPVKSLELVVKNNDLLTSVSHRHECPVSSAPITVIADTDDFFVVNKPCSIPLHPAGRFRHNSLILILAREFKKKEIFSIHRLDRMTSGLTVFAKTKERAHLCHKDIVERNVQKEYVCRVVGDFTKFSLPEIHDHRIEVKGDEVTISEPIKVYDMKIGTSIVSRDDNAKDSITVFKCLSTDGKTSVLRCMPKTGRTHQIRVHLQFLGFPITNDVLYNSPAWGDDRFRLGPITKSMDIVVEEISVMKKYAAMIEGINKTMEDEKNAPERSRPEDNSPAWKEPCKPPELTPALAEAIEKVDGIVPYRPDCEECMHPLPDPKSHELVMYLHALKYKGSDWEFETPLPEWASPDWTDHTDNKQNAKSADDLDQ